MNFRQLTSTGDWTFGGGLANYASATQAIELNLQTSIQMWQGDFFASLAGWVNWKGLMQVGTQKQLNAALQSVISNCYGVQQIISAAVVINTTTRQFFPTYDLVDIYSEQVVNQIQILSGQPGTN